VSLVAGSIGDARYAERCLPRWLEEGVRVRARANSRVCAPGRKRSKTQRRRALIEEKLGRSRGAGTSGGWQSLGGGCDIRAARASKKEAAGRWPTVRGVKLMSGPRCN
jgi:hypothetical protein